MAISLCLHLVLFLCFGLTDNSEWKVLQVLLGTLISSCSYTLICYITTLWVLKRNDAVTIERPPSVSSSWTNSAAAHNRKNSGNSNNSGRFNFLTSFRGSPPDGNAQTDSNILTLRDLLRDKHGWNLFMMHSSKELSVENLLFICEVHQFKEALSKQHLSGKLVGWHEDLPSEFIPRCEAVSSHPGDYLSQMHLIYTKYIVPGSPLEINVSARRRRRILNQFDDEKQEGNVDRNLMAIGWSDLSKFFDRCALEIWKLMKDSFTRLVETREYELWEKRMSRHNQSSSGQLKILSVLTKTAHIVSASKSVELK